MGLQRVLTTPPPPAHIHTQKHAMHAHTVKAPHRFITKGEECLRGSSGPPLLQHPSLRRLACCRQRFTRLEGGHFWCILLFRRGPPKFKVGGAWLGDRDEHVAGDLRGGSGKGHSGMMVKVWGRYEHPAGGLRSGTCVQEQNDGQEALEFRHGRGWNEGVGLECHGELEGWE